MREWRSANSLHWHYYWQTLMAVQHVGVLGCGLQGGLKHPPWSTGQLVLSALSAGYACAGGLLSTAPCLKQGTDVMLMRKEFLTLRCACFLKGAAAHSIP